MPLHHSLNGGGIKTKQTVYAKCVMSCLAYFKLCLVCVLCTGHLVMVPLNMNLSTLFATLFLWAYLQIIIPINWWSLACCPCCCCRLCSNGADLWERWTSGTLLDRSSESVFWRWKLCLVALLIGTLGTRDIVEPCKPAIMADDIVLSVA